MTTITTESVLSQIAKIASTPRVWGDPDGWAYLREIREGLGLADAEEDDDSDTGWTCPDGWNEMFDAIRSLEDDGLIESREIAAAAVVYRPAVTR